MNLKRYKIFTENIRSDEHSHLNDGLAKANKKLESRWDNEDDDYDYDDDSTNAYGDAGDDYLWGRPNHSKSSLRDDEYEGYEDGEDEDIREDDMQHLLYLLRTMFKNSGIDDVEIENKKLDITIYCRLNRRERLKDIIKVFEVANKLKKDILSQYDSEFDMWSNRDGSSNLVFSFMYDEGLDDDNAPF